jgi:hypothetical protein
LFGLPVWAWVILVVLTLVMFFGTCMSPALPTG